MTIASWAWKQELPTIFLYFSYFSYFNNDGLLILTVFYLFICLSIYISLYTFHSSQLVPVGCYNVYLYDILLWLSSTDECNCEVKVLATSVNAKYYHLYTLVRHRNFHLQYIYTYSIYILYQTLYSIVWKINHHGIEGGVNKNKHTCSSLRGYLPSCIVIFRKWDPSPNIATYITYFIIEPFQTRVFFINH